MGQALDSGGCAVGGQSQDWDVPAFGSEISKPYPLRAELEEKGDKEPNLQGRVMQSDGRGWKLSQPRSNQVQTRVRLPTQVRAVPLKGPQWGQEVPYVTLCCSGPLFHFLPHPTNPNT